MVTRRNKVYLKIVSALLSFIRFLDELYTVRARAVSSRVRLRQEIREADVECRFRYRRSWDKTGTGLGANWTLTLRKRR